MNEWLENFIAVSLGMFICAGVVTLAIMSYCMLVQVDISGRNDAHQVILFRIAGEE